MYGDKVLNEEQLKGKDENTDAFVWFEQMCNSVFSLLWPSVGERIRGWFPRRCVEKCHYDTAASDSTSDKKVN